MPTFIQRSARTFQAATGAILLLWWGVPPARAGEILVQVHGIVADGERSDQVDASGSAAISTSVSYSSSLSLPTIPGSFFVSSRAAEGDLGASAFISVGNAPGHANPTYIFWGKTNALGTSSFLDSWTFHNQPLDTPGKLQVTLEFHGSASAIATGASASAVGLFDFDIGSNSGLPNEDKSYHSGELTNANETAVLAVDFHYGRPIIVDGRLQAGVAIDSDLGAFTYSGIGHADFLNTAKLVKLEVQDENGQWTTNYDLTTESGAIYPFQAVAQSVPEPSTLVISAALLGLFGVICSYKRLKQITPAA